MGDKARRIVRGHVWTWLISDEYWDAASVRDGHRCVSSLQQKIGPLVGYCGPHDHIDHYERASRRRTNEQRDYVAVRRSISWKKENKR